MLKTNSKIMSLTIALSLLNAPAYAQDNSEIETLNPPSATMTTVKKRVRIVEAIPLWVDAEKLRVRDNPYAGDVVGLLEMGQKVEIHAQADNWIRISSDGKPTKWVNEDFLSTTRVSWSNYEFGSRSRRSLTAPYDVDLERIKVKDLKDMKVYAAHIKAVETGRVVITRHDFRSGPYYEKRLVSCDDGNATHVRMLGEGYNYMMMESDPRGASITEAADTKHALSDETSALNRAIAEFTCEAKDI